MQAFRCKDRKGSGVPYIMHLLAVCAMVGDHGGDASIGPGTDIQVFQRMMAAIEAASVIRRLGGTGR